jgi:hypothetical protein
MMPMESQMIINRPGNQLHGKAFENLIQRAQGCPVQNFNALFDLPQMYDDYGMQVQIKTVNEKRDRVDLADASRFWRNQQPIHLLVARYRQEGLVKVFHTIDEYLLGVSALREIKGKIPSWEVERVHDEVKSYRRGEHVAARGYAHSSLALLEATYGVPVVMLNAKIDSLSQRRIQCSVKLRDIEKFKIRMYTESYQGIRLPMSLVLDGQD